MVLEQAASAHPPEFLITAAEGFGIAGGDNEYHEWIMGGPDKQFGTRALRRGINPSSVGTPDSIASESTPAEARIDAGVWLADCPSQTCNSAMTLVRNATGFMCGDCFNADVPGRSYRPLVWPDAKTLEDIEKIMLNGKRPELSFMHWRPGKTVEELDGEEDFHHSWTTPKTYSVGAVGTAAERNTYERDNLLETVPAKLTAAGEVPYGTAANTLAVVSPTAGGILGWNAAGTALEAKSVGASPIGAMDWNTTIGALYSANFADADADTNGTRGDIFDAGWTRRGSASFEATNSTGDLDAIGDVGRPAHYILASGSTDGIASPAIIGGWVQLEAIAAVTGAAIATIQVDIFAQFVSTNDSDASGPALLDVNGSIKFAFIASGSNFHVLPGDTDTGVAKDTAWHKFSFRVDVGNNQIDYLIDGTERVSNTAVTQDIWPVAAGGKAESSNNVLIGPIVVNHT